MTVIAGVSLFNGVMLAADCRVTIRRPGRVVVFCDTAQKLFPLTQTTVIGFSGDVATAAAVLLELFRQLARIKRKDPVSLERWLSRFFRTTVAVLAKKGRARRVDFMVASVLPGRTNLIPRKTAAELLKEIAFGNPSAQRNWVPGQLMHVMMAPAGQELVPMPGSIAGRVCTMSYPKFHPKCLKPLEFAAIGSGKNAVVELKRNADWLLAGMPGNDLAESMALASAVSQFVAENEIQDVGGMYPCVKIDQRGVGCLGGRHRYPLYEVSLTYNAQRQRWIQENHTIGKRIELQYPWEIMRAPGTADRRFDDMREALEKATPLRARRAKHATS